MMLEGGIWPCGVLNVDNLGHSNSSFRSESITYSESLQSSARHHLNSLTILKQEVVGSNPARVACEVFSTDTRKALIIQCYTHVGVFTGQN